eukprot:m.295521 g.295521  ORF g.295521 m.295521 type:complete len:581 (+) comp13217_c0_seq1:106-1848(+)
MRLALAAALAALVTLAAAAPQLSASISLLLSHPSLIELYSGGELEIACEQPFKAYIVDDFAYANCDLTNADRLVSNQIVDCGSNGNPATLVFNRYNPSNTRLPGFLPGVTYNLITVTTGDGVRFSTLDEPGKGGYCVSHGAKIKIKIEQCEYACCRAGEYCAYVNDEPVCSDPRSTSDLDGSSCNDGNSASQDDTCDAVDVCIAEVPVVANLGAIPEGFPVVRSGYTAVVNLDPSAEASIAASIKAKFGLTQNPVFDIAVSTLDVALNNLYVLFTIKNAPKTVTLSSISSTLVGQTIQFNLDSKAYSLEVLSTQGGTSVPCNNPCCSPAGVCTFSDGVPNCSGSFTTGATCVDGRHDTVDDVCNPDGYCLGSIPILTRILPVPQNLVHDQDDPEVIVLPNSNIIAIRDALSDALDVPGEDITNIRARMVDNNLYVLFSLTNQQAAGTTFESDLLGVSMPLGGESVSVNSTELAEEPGAPLTQPSSGGSSASTTLPIIIGVVGVLLVVGLIAVRKFASRKRNPRRTVPQTSMVPMQLNQLHAPDKIDNGMATNPGQLTFRQEPALVPRYDLVSNSVDGSDA